MNQQYHASPTRRDYIAICPKCGREHKLHTSNTHGARCIDCLVPLKMPPAPTERQEEYIHSNFSTKEANGQ